MDSAPVEGDPLISAVVELRPEAEASRGAPLENPAGVASEAAAMLQGYNLEQPPDSGSPEIAPAGTGVPESGSATARAKGFFTRAGFEVHAPVGTSFSIAARRSHFEAFFGQSLVVDESQLGSPVTTAAGDRELPLGVLPDDVAHIVRSVAFLPPPELPTAGL